MTQLEACLLDLEDFLRVDVSSPALMALPLRMAVAHVQFEAIHPFSEGNAASGGCYRP